MPLSTQRDARCASNSRPAMPGMRRSQPGCLRQSRRAQQSQPGFAAYLLSSQEGISADTTYFADRGIQLSCGFRALKVWMSMKEQGVDRIGAAIQANIDQAHYLAARVEASDDLELLTPVSMNVVCFRYAPDGIAADRLDELNQAILIQLQVRGIAVPSQTILDGRFAIRVSPTIDLNCRISMR